MPTKGTNLFTFTAGREGWSANIGWIEKTLPLKRAYSYNMGSKDKREVKKILLDYFEFIETEWDRFQKEAQK